MTVVETTVVVSTATTVAGSPIVAGLVGPIPALEFLAWTKGQAHINFGWLRLLAWAIGVTPFGPILAMKLRERYLGRDVKEEMPFPTARAITVLIQGPHAQCHEEDVMDMGRDIPEIGEENDLNHRELEHDQSRPSTPSEEKSRVSPTAFVAFVLASGFWVSVVDGLMKFNRCKG
jgi:uncharacterized oligopeptide transporter (OPT) family protein